MKSTDLGVRRLRAWRRPPWREGGCAEAKQGQGERDSEKHAKFFMSPIPEKKVACAESQQEGPHTRRQWAAADAALTGDARP
jgi:hypothetical protein